MVFDTHYLFKIKNTGPKIHEKEQFLKLGYTTKSKKTGEIREQELFTVKEIVKKYYSKITIESNEESETMAIVEIPIK